MKKTGASAEVLHALRGALGADAVVVRRTPTDIDGVPVAGVARPESGEALATALRVLGESGGAAIVRGAGTHLAFGNPPRRADVILSTERLGAIRTLDTDEGVALVEAGVSLAVLRAEAAKGGWDVPVDAHDERATLGGVVAAAATGPHVQRHGPVRDHVLGLEVVLATGERTRCGGRVVKNVTGYDLAKLHTGACGTLGVIESVWLRLRPLPEQVQVLCAWLAVGDAGFRSAARAARAPALRALALVDPALAGRVDPSGPEKGRRLLVIELAGSEPELARARRELQELGAEPRGPEGVERLRRLQGVPAAAEGLRFRIVAQPGRLEAVAAPLSRAGAALLVYPGVSFVYAGFPDYEGADSVAVDAAWRAVREAARAGAGHAVLEAGPPWAKTVRDVFGDAPEALPLFRALKESFDPKGVLNPGRFAGGI